MRKIKMPMYIENVTTFGAKRPGRIELVGENGSASVFVDLKKLDKFVRENWGCDCMVTIEPISK